MKEENVHIYSNKEREKAMKLYIKHDERAANVIRELGYQTGKHL